MCPHVFDLREKQPHFNDPHPPETLLSRVRVGGAYADDLPSLRFARRLTAFSYGLRNGSRHGNGSRDAAVDQSGTSAHADRGSTGRLVVLCGRKLQRR